MNRSTAREKALQILFQLNINEIDVTESMAEHVTEKEMNPFLTTLVEGVIEHSEEIDQIIVEHLEHWTIDRIALVEKTALKIAVYEMKFLEDIPVNVSINEAVELAKKFGDEKSGQFVNGVLSKIQI